MTEPINQAAHLIVSAQSVITDLTAQHAEIQQAITRQQDLIDSLMPIAQWEEPEPEPEDPEEPEPEPELPGGSEVLPDGEPVDDPEPGEPDLETDDPDPAE